MKKKLMPVSIAFGVLVLLVVALMLRNTFRSPTRIVLPDETDAAHPQNSVLNPIEITPETVQSAIASLHRPEAYSRTVTVERYYGGGSGKATVQMTVSDGWTRSDLSSAGDATRHMITDGKTTYLWYGTAKNYYQGTAAFSADEEQGIPTYEDVLALDQSSIVSAEYAMNNDVPCICVVAKPDGDTTETYWIGVESGLLIAAEKMQGEETVYRMSSSAIAQGESAAAAFTLPDGKVLIGE